MFKVLFWSLAIYFLYRFIFGLVIPVSRTANQLKKKMAEMQAQQAYQQQEAYQSQQSGNQQKPASNSGNGAFSNASSKGDYLDFEEVK
ncbi:DUF4834 family protein [Sediminibacterium sp. TEGAF015]|uniref:DUF4834 family protein n=1 Tax=Sediminibacterium sp. TEGAF015 TaxID=575378 RepID=UPI0021FD5F93|nr:DUF4834 family protein [Sediminibacterium sp. TEGAF015]BDQ12921.1 hypothetical protein TEGAF0_21380 [Sediminibacterium sp. TEGAF015]